MGQSGEEGGVGRVAVVHRQSGQQRERRAFLEFATLAGPRIDPPPRVRTTVEQVQAQRVADRPVVELPAPAVHLRDGELRGVGDEGDQQARFVDAAVP